MAQSKGPDGSCLHYMRCRLRFFFPPPASSVLTRFVFLEEWPEFWQAVQPLPGGGVVGGGGGAVYLFIYWSNPPETGDGRDGQMPSSTAHQQKRRGDCASD